MGKRLSAFIIILIVFSALLTAYFLRYYYTVLVESDKTVIIHKGAGVKEIASILSSHGIIPETYTFRVIAAYNMKQGRYLQSGEYFFPSSSNIQKVFSKLLSGDRVTRHITIPEGFTNFQILNLLKGLEGLKGSISVNYSDGDFLPETYHFYYGDTVQSLLEHMQKNMRHFLESEFQPSKSYFENMQDVVIMASIVEREARFDDERPIIASVYLNRLKIGMPLQADPTVIYALKKGETDFNYVLSRSDLTTASPFNTYQNRGLPPTPICNPGKASIKAVLNPANTDYLYFVADRSGRHISSNTYKKHLQNIAAINKDKS